MGNVIFGIIMIVGGASGHLALRGTDSSGALVVVGFLLLGYGVWQMKRGGAGSR